jgi:hypothetical protein
LGAEAGRWASSPKAAARGEPALISPSRRHRPRSRLLVNRARQCGAGHLLLDDQLEVLFAEAFPEHDHLAEDAGCLVLREAEGRAYRLVADVRIELDLLGPQHLVEDLRDLPGLWQREVDDAHVLLQLGRQDQGRGDDHDSLAPARPPRPLARRRTGSVFEVRVEVEEDEERGVRGAPHHIGATVGSLEVASASSPKPRAADHSATDLRSASAAACTSPKARRSSCVTT